MLQHATAPAETAAIPRHVAIIMDGNGRWAKARGLPRTAGHRRGVETVREVVRGAGELGIAYLTLFGFSTENWKRPAAEVDFLMGLLRHYMRSELDTLAKEGARLRVIGDRDGLPRDIAVMIGEAETRTRANARINVTIALNYGGRADIVRAAQRLAERVAAGTLAPDTIDETTLTRELLTAEIPDPDLLIRTSGEQRISNFLLWQSAYAEMLFVDTLWPDFGKAQLAAAVAEYSRRERRYGALAG
ncbi:MAG: isoprenyl transferase [Alphaproteobacteria bacterium]|nr:isoprenyl transferase [Alphaproteobacteria bacterium]